MLGEFLFILWFVTHLGSEAFGVISFGYAVCFIIFQFTDIRVTDFFIQFFTKYRASNEKNKLVALTHLALLLELYKGMVSFVFCNLLAWIMPYFFPEYGNLREIIHLSSFILLFNNLTTSTGRGVLRVLDKFSIAASISTFAVWLKLGLCVLCGAIVHMGSIDVLAVTIISYVILTLVFFFFCQKELKKQLGFSFELSKFNHMVIRSALGADSKELVNFTKHMYLTSLSMVPTKELDVNILGWLTTMEVVGLYKIGKNFLAAIWSFIDAVYLVCYPKISYFVHNKQMLELKVFLILLRKAMFFMGVFLYFTGFLIVPHAINVFYGLNSDLSGDLFKIMSLGVLIWAPFVWLAPLVLAHGRADIISKGALLTAALLVFLYPVFIFCWGAYGGAIITALVSPLTVLLTYIPASKKLNLSPFFIK